VTTPGDPNEPRPRGDDGTSPEEPDQHAFSGEERPDQPGPADDLGEPPAKEEAPASWWADEHRGEEPIEPAPPVVPPTAPPTPPPTPQAPPEPPQTGDTQAFPKPGSTPSYPGWESSEPSTSWDSPGTGAAQPGPSRYDPPTPSTPPTPPPGPPSGPYAGAPKEHGYGQQAAGAPYGGPEEPKGPGEPDQPGVPGAAPYGGAETPVPGVSPSSPYGGAPGGPSGAYTPPPGGPAHYQQDWGGKKPGHGLAIASLVLGVASLFLLLVCFVGVLTAVVAIVLGAVALSKGASKGMSWTGIGFGILTLLLAVAAFFAVRSYFSDCANLPPKESEICVQNKIPWGKH
jgi:hypothetical protein